MTVQPAHGLSPEEVERLVLESVDHAQEDFRARLLIELRNKADAELRHTEKGLRQAGDSLSPAERSAVDAATAAGREAQAGDDPDRLRAALDALARATQPLAERLMNAVVAATLRGHTADEIRPDLLK